MWSGRRLTRKQLTSRPDYLWPELWTKLGRNAKLKERQKCSHEKPQLDNARKLRGIYFIDPEDKEFKETIKNARKKLETSWLLLCLANLCKQWKNCGRPVDPTRSKQRLACILEADESTRLRMGESLPNHHEDHIAGKGTIHCSITIWFTNFSYASSHENSCSKSSSGQGMGEIGKFRRGT